MRFSNSYARLPQAFFQRAAPTPVRAPKLLLWNDALAEQLAVPPELAQDQAALADVFAGNRTLAGSEPIAMAYAGHQFGHFVPQLGDGRAHLLGEVIDRDGNRRDIQLKGSGRSAFSRNGDGRCALGPAIREFVMSEALFALGVPTTRSLAVVTTGESVYRQGPVPGAVITRVASSHIRVGTFEFFASRGNVDALGQLCEYTIARHYPDLSQNEDKSERYVALLGRIIDRQIHLISEWMRIGFIHGVMNTDNTALSGETIDYGPCAMMSAYNPETVFSSIDQMGRYAFGNQPAIMQWNMSRLAECLIPLVADDEQRAVAQLAPVIDGIVPRFRQAWLQMMRNKLGLVDEQPTDSDLVTDLLVELQRNALDYTVTFRRLGQALTSGSDRTSGADRHDLRQQLGPWFERWQQRLQAQQQPGETIQASMHRHNPTVIPRNHHMEAVIEQGRDSGNAESAERFLAVLRTPYDEHPQTHQYQDPPADGDQGYQTFCGT